MRTTIKQGNKIMDDIKVLVGLPNRPAASRYLYTTIAPRFKELGYSLSHYLNGLLSITSDHFHYVYITPEDLLDPPDTISRSI